MIVKLAMIPKVLDNGPFDRIDFVRQTGAGCVVVLVPQAARNAAGGQNQPAEGDPKPPIGVVAVLARSTRSPCTLCLAEWSGFGPSNGSLSRTFGIRYAA
jgi:hypothetical protein